MYDHKPMAFFPPAKTRAESLRAMSPHLIAEVYLYETSEGGKTIPAQAGWGCPCSESKSTENQVFYDGWPLLEEPLAPGERRRVGFVFIAEALAVDAMVRAGTFYLWEGRFVGEATVVSREPKKF